MRTKPSSRSPRPAAPLRPSRGSGAIRAALRGLPPLEGAPIRIRFRRRLESGLHGTEVHAATFLRKRLILLETGLVCHRRELARILVHELFHFVWLRLGNPVRRSFEALLRREWRAGAAGELGWSAEWRKQALGARDRRQRTRRWREYVCESFCDSAAWWLAGKRPHD